MRDRVYMIAFRRDVGATIRFPAATHKCDLPSGYRGTRSVALKLIDLFGSQGYVDADKGNESLPDAVSAQQAISDLPSITLHREGKLQRGARRFDEIAKYRRISSERLSSYAFDMRTWSGFEAGEGVYDHVLRYLPRDAYIFEAMQSGEEYPAARLIAERLFEVRAKGRNLEARSLEWEALRKSMVPPYDPTKFPNRWWKLHPDRPVRTLTAHIGKDTYTHIHYDSQQARVITVREAARLQSFPDGFIFAGAMNPAFRQIGNAVPPVLARELAQTILGSLRGAVVPAIAAE